MLLRCVGDALGTAPRDTKLRRLEHETKAEAVNEGRGEGRGEGRVAEAVLLVHGHIGGLRDGAAAATMARQLLGLKVPATSRGKRVLGWWVGGWMVKNGVDGGSGWMFSPPPPDF